MQLPSPDELKTLAACGAVEVTTFGQEGDPFVVVHDRLDLVDGELTVERRVLARKPAEFIVLRCETNFTRA